MQNIQDITNIHFTQAMNGLFCPLGQQSYNIEIDANIANPSKIPDYLDLQGEMLSLEGQQLIIEDAVASVYEMCCAAFGEGACVKVTGKVGQSKHFPVEVTKERC